jgi:energy-converting hydrogenase Eha subunit F
VEVLSLFYFIFLFIYSHVHTLFGSFLHPAPLPHPLPPSPLPLAPKGVVLKRGGVSLWKEEKKVCKVIQKY